MLPLAFILHIDFTVHTLGIDRGKFMDLNIHAAQCTEAGGDTGASIHGRKKSFQIKEVLMVRNTIRRLSKQLEQMTDREISMNRAFDILFKKATSIEDIVVVEVMREVYLEILEGEMAILSYADSSTRSARIPLIALSR